MTDALTIATTFLDAWVAQDLDTAGAQLADDFVFDGPVAHYRSAADFLTGSRNFVKTIEPRWDRIAAFGDGEQALLLYDVVLLSGRRLRIADHYQVRAGKIVQEEIVWDTYGVR
jgi:hypothetical protein